jgi:hypothetical protein
MQVKSWDPKCQDLAEHFLTDVPLPRGTTKEALARLLAREIQQAIEDWLAEMGI